MEYSRVQKIISYFLLFIFFFNISIQIPSITSLVLAKESSFYNLVSIIVDEKTYAEIKSELDTYGQNISNNLENTKVVILPVPENATVFSVASMNEGLYFDGYKSLANVDFESKLVGTVFVGNIKIPRVYKGEEFARTVLPYVDFDKKSFVFSKERNRYEENETLNYEIKPEIEFGFISPNTGNFKDDVQAIKDYFSKNNDFYKGRGIYSLDATKRGQFASGDSILNGVKSGESGSASGNPYVFYYDYIRENQSFNGAVYPSYLVTRDKNQDLNYGWYNKDILGDMSSSSKNKKTDEINKIAKELDPDFKFETEDLDIENVFDIQTKNGVERLKKNFIDNFGKGVLGELRKDVFNAGRYNFGSNVHVDFIPYMISRLDIYNDEILKSQDITEMEGVKMKYDSGEYSRKIAVPISFENEKGDIYKNFLFGKEVQNITNASECSIYRGTHQRVEANRGKNLSLVPSDTKRLEAMGKECLPDGAIGLWGNNSPLKLDENINLTLKGANHKGAIEDLFDIKGAKIKKGMYGSPYQCFDNNFLLYEEYEYLSNNGGNFFKKLKYKMKGLGWTCLTNNASKSYGFIHNHIENEIKDFKDPRNNTSCDVNIFLEGKLVRQLINEDYYKINFLAPKPTAGSKPSEIYIIRKNFELSKARNSGEGNGNEDEDEEKKIPNCLEIYKYKGVDSFMWHREPTPETINSQSKDLVASNLPIDKDWYVDFINVNGSYGDGGPVFTGGNFDKKELDDQKKPTIDIEGVIRTHPYYGKTLALGGDEISLLLRKNSGNVKPDDNKFTPSKEQLKFAMDWNHFTPNQKYSFVFDNYLRDKGRLEKQPFLPDHKEEYEISYLGGYGNATEMMIAFHPEAKKENLFSESVSKNQEISAKIFANNVVSGKKSLDKKGKNSTNTTSGSSRGHSSNGLFKCGPPDGVPIWEWMDAISCRLGDMLPPKINISSGTCSATHFDFSVKSEGSFINSSGNLQIRQSGQTYNNSGNNSVYPGFQNNNVVNSGQVCTTDEDKNGISDCLEKINKLNLTSDSSVYSHNGYVGLIASFYENENKANFINNAFVNFEIVKIEKAKDEQKDISSDNLETVFDLENKNLSYKKVISNYINFKETKVPSIVGDAKYSFSSKNQDLNVYVKATSETISYNGQSKKVLESSVLKVEIRGNSLSTITSNFSKKDKIFSNSFGNVEVSENSNIYLLDINNKNIEDFKDIIDKNTKSDDNLIIGINSTSKSGKILDLKYPLNVKILKNSEILQENILNTKQEIIALNKISEIGTYTLKITDGNGLSTTREIFVNSSKISEVNIKLGSDVLLKNGSVSTNFFTILDKFKNPVSGQRFIANLKLEGDFSFFDSEKNSKNISLDVLEGYRVFRIKSGETASNGKLIVDIVDPETNKILSTKNISIKSIDSANIKLENVDLTAGGEAKKIKLSIIDNAGKVISDLNSRVYFTGNEKYFSTTESYFEVKNGVAEIELTTGNISSDKIPVEIQVEGIGKIFSEKIFIKALEPVKVDVIVHNGKIQANKEKFTYVTFELKDKFNNTVINHPETTASLSLEGEIRQDSEKIIFKNGVASTKIFATDTPGIGHFKVTVTPDLSKNTFTLQDGTVVNGVSENIGKIETFYFLNKETLNKTKKVIENGKEITKNFPMNFNGLYTVLQGSNYGDLEQKDYLAGALVFDKNNRTLASTSIVDNSENRNNIISVNNNGKFSEVFSSKDLSQSLQTNIGIDENKIYFDIYNESLNTNIGKIFYNLNQNEIGICEEGVKCFDENKTGIYGKNISKNNNFKIIGENLVLTGEFGEEILSIDKKGNFFKKSDFELILEKNNSKNLELKILRGNQNIGNIIINISKPEIGVSKNKEIFENRKKSKEYNSILFFIESNFYGTYNSLDETIVFYNDPFASNKSLNSFAKMSQDGFENYKNKAGIGWKDGNKTLLSFASGKTVGSSVKDFMGFYTINIGDPFIKLKTERKNFNGTDSQKQFDNTIGEIISNDENVVDYKVFDYNNDGRKDILLVKDDNYLELLENVNTYEKFLSRGNLVQIYDNSGSIETGDFSGDGFEDIFFVGTDGNPYLLNNISKNFTRFDLVNKLDLDSKVSQISAFDMDNDKIKDLVILTEKGELFVFYGGGTSANLTFTKKKIADNLGLTLSKGSRKDNSFIYYSGLYQPEQNPKVSDTELVDKGAIDSEIFVNVSYSNDKLEVNKDNFSNLNVKHLDQKFFLKSEYLDTVGIKYEKIFTDRNGGNLNSGDIVDIEIKVSNNTGRSLTNVKFLELFEKYFEVDPKNISNDKNLEIILGDSGYHFGLEKFSLKNDETITIKYSGKTREIKHIEIKTGYFEKGEPGDDLYGDIIVDDFNRSCKSLISTYKSIAAREYKKSEIGQQCNITELPKELKRLEKDDDKNGMPDFIDEMKNSNEIAQKFGKEEMSKLNSDKDNDGIPDDTDFFDNLNNEIDEAENLLEGLSCGYNSDGCIKMPLNWAPLAPGGDPTFMGKPIGDGLKIDEGLPIFSAITWIPPIPVVWPISPLAKDRSLGAGGWLGIDSKTNFVRIFVTPTLTGGVGTAICFGAPASKFGKIPPKGVSPIKPGGNCIVIAKPLLKCSPDGSDGDPENVQVADNFGGFSVVNGGAGKGGGNSSSSFSNSGSCNHYSGGTSLPPDYIKSYIGSSGGKYDKSLLQPLKFKNITENFSSNGQALFNVGPENGVGTPITVTLSSKGGGDFSDIEKIEQKRITPFPAFLMDWIQRQINEIISKLTDFPTIFIILPDFSGIYDSEKNWEENWKDYQNKSSERSSSNKIIQVNSGIREAYEFMSTLPLININQETVNISIPWIDKNEIARAKASWNETIKQRKEELKKFKSSASYDSNIESEINKLIGDIQKNIGIIESYGEIPEKLKKLVNKKQDYLDQILCNVEEITDVIGLWIGQNGERFKAWVELYLTIKAILKSWQTFIDIFIDFDNECRECKNERHDLIDYQMQLISMIIPKIPVVEFPKWPDIVLDLHNIRVGLDLSIPDFETVYRPINIPDLPNLNLPSVSANINISLPKIPTLPEFQVPELPDLPSIPKIELPDLPPPLKLPKLFEGFEFIIKIAKLVTKALCLLKTLPLHPEWRAGDQIAFLTERNGFMGFDYKVKSLPEFKLPFVDAIKVSTYVNLEIESDFLVDFAESVVEPINSFTSDFTNKLDISIPTEVNVDLDVNANLTSYNDLIKKSTIGKGIIAKLVSEQISTGLQKAEENKNILLTSSEFIASVNNTLASKEFADSKFDDLRQTWNILSKYDFAEEDKLIKSLQKYNFEKYETIKNILETEKIKNKNLEKDLENIFLNGKVKISEKNSSDFEKYREEMGKFNKITFEKIGQTINIDEKNSINSEIKSLGQDILDKTKDTIGQRAKELQTTKTPLENYKSGLLAVNNNPSLVTNPTSGTCSANSSSNYSHSYSGIYVKENGKSYRLFDYKDEVDGDEVTEAIDFDLDGDEDLLYFVNGTLYLKENFSKKDAKKIYLNEKPLIINSSENKFLNIEKFIESVNDAEESDISNGIVSVEFSSLENIYNYRLSFYDIIDKFSNPFREEIDLSKNKHIVDGIADSENISLVSEEENYIKRKDIAYIKNIGHFRGFELETFVFDSIKDNLLAGNTVTVSSGTKIYSGQNYLEFSYRIDGEDNTKTIKLEPNHNIEAKEDIIIMGITRGDGYISTGEIKKYNGDEISKMKGYPLLFDAKINFVGDKNDLKENSFLDIGYYENSELRLDFNKINSWEMYDLGELGKKYLFSVSRKNDYYYAKINAFKNNIIGTSTSQILLSPQVKADKTSADIDLRSIKIPVYQEREIDVTDKIVEDSGFDGISNIFIDFYLDIDRDGDLNTKNDDDSLPNLKIFKKDNKIFIKAGKFTSLMNKKIGINIIDENGNNGFKEVDFTVYSPTPEIESFDGYTISGIISEELKDEPINFYRFRGGNLSKLGDEKNNFTVYTNEKGEFNINSGTFKGGLTLKNNSEEIATISEKTGKITINQKQRLSYNISVSTDKQTDYPEIFIKDNSGKNIFRESLKVIGNSKVGIVSDFNSLDGNGVYLKLGNDFAYFYYTLPENIANNPGVFVAFAKNDRNKTPIIKIFPDGRLELPENFKINYSEFKEYVVLKISDSSQKNNFEIIYKMDADYVVN